ncbi:glycosyltransferase family 32 protein [Paradesertivirga mongoliensis]|uniref:Glycosyltransferase family 32 protein n=1 Tax=Paradesertivirga mongoliensis TaxID=2100740 RepID=A0ABW4ZI60_9SPHI|nr:glycosyltransferase [Pedobacter mongoliensis]
MKKLPFITRWHVSNFRKKNPEYQYEFYDDGRIESFFETEFEDNVLQAYRRLNIGAAKADMFRYAILLKKGGIYLDIDSGIKGRLSDFILPDDRAVITRERNPDLYVQWALVYEANHPFLKRTLDLVLENISLNKFPHDVHATTGPTVYTKAINECLQQDPSIPHRVLGVDYEGHLISKYRLGKFFLYNKGDHWKKKQLSTPVLKP